MIADFLDFFGVLLYNLVSLKLGEAVMDRASFVPRVMSDYEVDQALSAIETVSQEARLVIEIVSTPADPADLEADLRSCLEFAGNPNRVRPWIRRCPDGPRRQRCGFYREELVLGAIDFLD